MGTISLFIGIWGLSAYLMDHFLRGEESQKSLDGRTREWLSQVKQYDSRTLLRSSQTNFLAFFDRIYGARNRFGQFFVRSTVSSIFALTTSVYLFYILHPDFSASVDDALRKPKPYLWLLGMLLGNVIADYVSLHETRWLLALAFNRSGFMLFGMIFLDLALSYIIFETIAVPISETLLNPGLSSPIHGFWLTDVPSTIDGRAVAPFVASTFFTSVAFYLFSAWTFLIKFSERLWRSLPGMLSLIAGHKHPFLLVILLLSLPALALTLVLGTLAWCGTFLGGG